ncbi:hypothetical protein DFH28DRAFT_901219 [Melampsora americana]|nr:hypothetical protein DFH28DRAFT_901219 [Melampsora americana]
MKTCQYIESTFLYLNPTRPISPLVCFANVGFVCPICLEAGITTPIKYINVLNGLWKVALTISDTFWSLALSVEPIAFSTAQLTHEFVSITSGQWPPTPYQDQVGSLPRPYVASVVAPFSGIPSITPSQNILNQLFAPLSSNTALSVRQGGFCIGVDSQTGQSYCKQEPHKVNMQCIYKACTAVGPLGDFFFHCPSSILTLYVSTVL